MALLIGITGKTANAAGDLPPAFAGLHLEEFITAYAESVAAAGGTPVLLSRHADPDALARTLDGFVIAGGNDVDPRRYGGVVGEHTTMLDPDRDAFESALILAAIANRRPVLGICRGTQILNVALGGTLVADLPVGDGESHAFLGYPVSQRTHRVDLEPGSRLAGLLGDRVAVNSYHHQAVDRLGDGLMVAGRAPDGVIEAVELSGSDVVGVQWHPEMFTDVDPVFHWLVTRCASAAARS